jgi:hypothetical protein
MASRRDDIVAEERVQIALEILSPERPRGQVKQLSQKYCLSRQTLYGIAAKGREILRQGLQPGAHGPQVDGQTIRVTKNRLRRAVLNLSEHGVSQRDTTACLAELLDSRVSPSWVNGELAKLEAQAAQANIHLTPSGSESLSGDEIYSNGQPNLLLVGNDSLYIYALTRQEGCDGDTWGCLLLDAPQSVQFASDAGTGLLAGAKEAALTTHQLDWDHLLRPLWGQMTRLEKKAYAALEQVEERAVLFEQSYTTRRLDQHLAKWQTLVAQAEIEVARADDFERLARTVDDCFALIDLTTGQLTDAEQGQQALQSVGRRLASWSGRIYQKLAKNLSNWAAALFSYQSPLRQALTPLQAQYGQQAIAALSRIWQCEADDKRRRLPWPEKQKRQQIWQQGLEEAWALLGEQQLWLAWADLSAILSRTWRGSMLAECVNSLLRPLLNQRKHTDQGCLELFRFLHNVRPFGRGKRVGHSPAELAGIVLPDDPLILLGLAPEVSS